MLTQTSRQKPFMQLTLTNHTVLNIPLISIAAEKLLRGCCLHFSIAFRTRMYQKASHQSEYMQIYSIVLKQLKVVCVPSLKAKKKLEPKTSDSKCVENSLQEKFCSTRKTYNQMVLSSFTHKNVSSNWRYITLVPSTSTLQQQTVLIE